MFANNWLEIRLLTLIRKNKGKTLNHKNSSFNIRKNVTLNYPISVEKQSLIFRTHNETELCYAKLSG